MKSIFDSIFPNPTTKIIVCNGITQYPIKEQRCHVIEEAHSSVLGGYEGVTKTYWLELAMFLYNTSVHEGTKCTSYEFVFSKLAREPCSETLSQQKITNV